MVLEDLRELICRALAEKVLEGEQDLGRQFEETES